MSCGVGCRRSSDLALLWLWCRLAATAQIQPLAWEPPYAACVALKRQKKKKKKEKRKDFIELYPKSPNMRQNPLTLCYGPLLS